MAKKDKNIKGPIKINKTQIIACRVTPDQHTRIKKAACTYGLTITQYMIKCVIYHSQERAKMIPELCKDLQKDFIKV